MKQQTVLLSVTNERMQHCFSLQVYILPSHNSAIGQGPVTQLSNMQTYRPYKIYKG